jgi:hypothetical protein
MLESRFPVAGSDTVPLIDFEAGAIEAPPPPPHPKRKSNREASMIAPNVNLFQLVHIQTPPSYIDSWFIIVTCTRLPVLLTGS